MSVSNCEMGEGTQMKQMAAWICNLPAVTELDAGDEQQGNRGLHVFKCVHKWYVYVSLCIFYFFKRVRVMGVVKLFNFKFEIISNLWRSCKNITENAHMPLCVRIYICIQARI